MNQTELYQRLWWQFEVENNYKPETARAVIEWAVDRGWLDIPVIDPYEVLAKQMSRALREQMGTASNGRRYRINHAVRVTENGEQKTLWVTADHGEPALVQMAFAQRREQIVGDCLQLKIDVDVYNERNPQCQFEFDPNFTDDLAEREIMELAA